MLRPDPSSQKELKRVTDEQDILKAAVDSIGQPQQLCENIGLRRFLNETNILQQRKKPLFLNYGRTEQASVK